MHSEVYNMCRSQVYDNNEHKRRQERKERFYERRDLTECYRAPRSPGAEPAKRTHPLRYASTCTGACVSGTCFARQLKSPEAFCSCEQPGPGLR